MNNDAPSNESAAPAASVPSPARASSPRAPEPRSRGGALALAVVLSLAAAGGAGYVGWQQWQQARANAAASSTLDGLNTRTATMESTLKAMDDERRTLRERLRPRRARLPQPVTRALAGGFAPLRAVHSGHIGDYVTWLVFGTAAIGCVLAVTIR